jgi:hypothetical protein
LEALDKIIFMIRLGMKKTNLILLHAYEIGYRCDEQGNVSSKKGIINPYINSNGYLSFSVKVSPPIHHKLASKAVPVHRLQAYQKHGDEIFGENIHVRHLNGNPLDNSYDNILIGSVSENSLDRPKHLRIKNAINASNKIRRFTDSEILEIKKFHKENKSTYKETMSKFNISSKGSLHYILNTEYVTNKG